MLAYFGVITLMALQIDFMSFLLDDNFNIIDDEAARVMGNIGFTGTVASIMFGLLLGALLDIIGRKVPTVAGLFLTGIFTSIIPVPKHIAWLYLFRCINNIGTMPLTQSPYPVDYVATESLGLFGAYFAIIVEISAILGSTVAI